MWEATMWRIFGVFACSCLVVVIIGHFLTGIETDPVPLVILMVVAYNRADIIEIREQK